VRLSPEQFQQQTLQFWQEARVKHLAKQQNVRYLQFPAKSYRDGLEVSDTISWTKTSTINDGLRSTLEYQKGWQGWQGQDAALEVQLNKAYFIDSVRIYYLADNQSWIMGPSKLTVSGQSMGTNAFQVSTHNPEVGQAQSNGTYPLVVRNFPAEPIQTLKIEIGNPGTLPKWRGVAGDGWLFIDEIEVYGHEK
jgi:hypothetical protein